MYMDIIRRIDTLKDENFIKRWGNILKGREGLVIQWG